MAESPVTLEMWLLERAKKQQFVVGIGGVLVQNAPLRTAPVSAQALLHYVISHGAVWRNARYYVSENGFSAVFVGPFDLLPSYDWTHLVAAENTPWFDVGQQEEPPNPVVRPVPPSSDHESAYNTETNLKRVAEATERIARLLEERNRIEQRHNIR